jgi:voltage-gated potassium channel
VDFAFWFIKSFSLIFFLASPIILFLGACIYLLGAAINRLEKWRLGWVGTFYYSFVTATTIGYGDYTPARRASQLLAVAIGFTGLIMTGIVVAIGLESVKISMRHLAADPRRLDVMQRVHAELYRGVEEQRPAGE